MTRMPCLSFEFSVSFAFFTAFPTFSRSSSRVVDEAIEATLEARGGMRKNCVVQNHPPTTKQILHTRDTRKMLAGCGRKKHDTVVHHGIHHYR